MLFLSFAFNFELNWSSLMLCVVSHKTIAMFLCSYVPMFCTSLAIWITLCAQCQFQFLNCVPDVRILLKNSFKFLETPPPPSHPLLEMFCPIDSLPLLSLSSPLFQYWAQIFLCISKIYLVVISC